MRVTATAWSLKAGVAAAALASLASAACAAQMALPFIVRVNIQSSCGVSVSPLDFGNVGTIFGGETASATITIACSSGTPYALSFSPVGITTSFAGQMVNGPNHVNYTALFGGANAGTGPGTLTITGVLPPQPTPPSAVYTDSRTVYLNY